MPKLVSLCNLNYRQFLLDYKREKISKKNKFRVLWCTTLYEFALSEYKIISEVFLNDKIDLCIRLHPAGHITGSEIRSLVPAGKYQISNHSLLVDFSNTDLVITNAFSSIFYDAIMVGLSVVRVCNRLAYVDYKGDFSPYLRDVSTIEEFSLLLKEKLNETNTNLPEHSEVLINNQMKPSAWNTLFQM